MGGRDETSTQVDRPAVTRSRETTSIFDRPGENIGGFVVRGEIGRGGAGRVLEAVDPRLRRRVALKHLLPERRGDQTARRRFIEEAQIAGRLEHPGILPVYHLGIAADGSEYFCMKLASGRDLGRVLEAWHKSAPEAQGWSLARLVATFERVVEAVGYAHDRGVLHRDLKPSNVMIGDHGEVWLLDWGLAKATSDRAEAPPAGVAPEMSPASPALTGHGLAVGTPSYMAPEQARGEPADQASDIFGLGAILYHIIAGKPPFAGKAVRTVMSAAAEGRVTPLRASPAGRRAPKQLTAICMKCLAVERADRYHDAVALLADLRAYAAGDAVAALPEGVAARGARWLRRHRELVGWAGGTFVALLAVVAVASMTIAAKDRHALQLQREKSEADQRASRAEEERLRALAEEAERARRRVQAFVPYAAAMDLIARGQLADEAVRLLEQALAIDARFAEARFALGEARRQLGQLAAAADDFLEADRLAQEIGGAPHVPALLAAAFAFDRAGEYEDADLAFARLDKAEPENPLAMVGRAYRDVRHCEFARALETARAAAEAAPHLWEAHVAHGEARRAAIQSGVLPRGEHDQAVLASLRRAHELAPRVAEVCAALGGELAQLPDPAEQREGRALIDRALALEPANGPLRLRRALDRLARGDAAGAREDVAEARRLGASEPLLLFQEAFFARAVGEQQRAFALYAEHARRFRCWPSHVGMWMRLALALGRLDEPEVRPTFDRWCDDNPRYPLALFLRGRDRLRRGEIAPAIASAESGLAIAPHDLELRALLALARYQASDLAGALTAADAALGLDAHHVPARKVRFYALASMRRLGEAESELTRLGAHLDAEEIARLRAQLAAAGK